MTTKKASITQALSPFRKAVVAFLVSFVGAIGTWMGVALSDGHISVGEWYAFGGAIFTTVATTFGVYSVPNEPV